jgi:hypothetical protein
LSIKNESLPSSSAMHAPYDTFTGKKKVTKGQAKSTPFSKVIKRGGEFIVLLSKFTRETHRA